VNNLNVVLIGYRGSGKSAVGEELAKKLEKKFVDTDELIEKKAGKTISQIFAEEGEPVFRQKEKQAVKEVSLQDNLVISCGGGVILDDENITALKRNSVIILLQAKPETIYKRIKGSNNRPALTGLKEFEEIKFLLQKRKPHYEAAADFVLDNDGLPIEAQVDVIIEFLEKVK
jgi:shikimate kinase